VRAAPLWAAPQQCAAQLHAAQWRHGRGQLPAAVAVSKHHARAARRVAALALAARRLGGSPVLLRPCARRTRVRGCDQLRRGRRLVRREARRAAARALALLQAPRSALQCLLPPPPAHLERPPPAPEWA
jgi:hypothetical protein